MEQIFKSLLQKQGYEHIGIIDAEKKIWGYAKDGVYHFCKEDLTDVKRTDVGFDLGVLVLSIIDDKIKNVKNEECVSSYIIIDNSNKIIAEKKGSFHLLRINSESLVMVLENSVSEYTFTQYHTPPCLYRYYPSFLQTHFYSQTIIFNGKIEKDSFLYKYNDSYYFFYIREYDENLRKIVYRTAKIIFNGIASTNQIIYEGAIPYVWLHKDNTLDIINVDDNRVVELISHSNTKKYNIPDMMGNSDLQLSYEIDNFNDDSILFPFSNGEGVFVLHRKLSKVVLEYKYYNYDTYCFYYFDKGETKLYGDIIVVSHTYPISCDSDTTDYFLYNIYGEYLTEYVPSSRGQSMIFRKYGNMVGHEECLYGVIKQQYGGGPFKMIIPPIYEKIKDVGEGYFEVYCRNPLNSKDYLIGVYETNNGLVIPLGMTFSYPQYYINFSNQAKLVGLPFGIVYSSGRCKGLILGSKVLDAKYDSIDGFSYYGDYFGEYVTTSHYGEEKRNNEYIPMSVILSKGGLKGLFFIDHNKGLSKNVIEPQYETIHCCMLLERHAYFEVSSEDKYGVISDSVKFNEISKCIYDKVEVENRKEELIVKVYKDGKIGMLSSNLNRSIPVKFNSLVILHKCYIGDGKYYSMRGVELLSEKEFVFIADGECCQAYKNRKTNEYIFMRSNGDKLDYNKRENGRIIEVKSSYCDDIYEFDVDKNSFVEDEPDDHSYYDDYDYEQDTWFAMTDGQYGDMPEDFDGDYDFTGH